MNFKPAATFGLLSAERILLRIALRLGLVIGDIADAQELERFEQRLAVVAEGDRAVMRQELFKIEQYVEMVLSYMLWLLP